MQLFQTTRRIVRRIPLMISLTAVACALGLGGAIAPAHAQKATASGEIKLRLDFKDTVLELGPTNFKPIVNANKTITVRVLVTRYITILPNDRDNEEIAFRRVGSVNLQNGILGKDLTGGPIEGLKFDLKNREISAPPAATNERIALFNRMRRIVTRKQQGIVLLGKDTSHPGVADFDAGEVAAIPGGNVFSFGDQEYNLNAAREAILTGNELVNIPDTLRTTVEQLRVLDDPLNVDDPKAKAEKVTLERLKATGRWYVDEYQGTYRGDRRQTLKFFVVRIVWGFEGDLDPKKEKQFGLLTHVGLPRKDEESNKALESNNDLSADTGKIPGADTPKPVETGTDAPEGGKKGGDEGVAPKVPPLVNAVIANIPADIFGAGGLPASRPGMEPVIGISIAGNGNQPRGIVGINFYPPNAVSEPNLNKGLITLHGDRFGALFAAEQGSGTNFLGALSYRMNPYLMAYAGVAFRKGSEATRWNGTFGFAFTISPLFGVQPPGTQAAATNIVEPFVTIEPTDAADRKRVLPLGTTNAGLIWTSVPPPDASTPPVFVPLSKAFDTLFGDSDSDINTAKLAQLHKKGVIIELIHPDDTTEETKLGKYREEQLLWVSWPIPQVVSKVRFSVPDSALAVDFTVVSGPVTLEQGKAYRAQFSNDKSHLTVKFVPL